MNILTSQGQGDDKYKGNPIRSIVKSAFQAPMSTQALVMDRIYHVDTLVRPLTTPKSGLKIDPVIPANKLPDAIKIASEIISDATGWMSEAEIGGDDLDDDDLPPERRPKQTVLRFKFHSAEWVNRVSFELANVPLNWSWWYYNDKTESMVQMTDDKGAPVGGSLVGQVRPGTVTSSSSGDLGDIKDVQKVDWGNFVHYQYDLPLIKTNLIELHLDRKIPVRFLPFETRARIRIPYPFVVRRVRFYYECVTKEQLPPPTDDIIITDPLGNVQRQVAQFWNAPAAIDPDSNSYWKCEPQPTADSIVPFYLDVRDGQGNAQLIDRLEMNPLSAGPAMNIYYSNDDSTPPQFLLSERTATFTVQGTVQLVEDIGVYIEALGSGVKIVDQTVSVGVVTGGGTSGQGISSVGCEATRLDMTDNWVVGKIFRPNFHSGIGGSTRRFFWSLDTGTTEIGVCFDPADRRFKLIYGGSVVLVQSDPYTFALGTDISLVVGFVHNDPTGEAPPGWHLGIGLGSGSGTEFITYHDVTPVIYPKKHVTQIVIGNNSTLVLPAVGWVRHVWIRQEAYSETVAITFHRNPRTFIEIVGPIERIRGDFNTVFLAPFTETYTVRLGPNDNFFDMKTWTPVFRDFNLIKGIIELPPTLCKYIKLEFSNLVAQSYPVWGEGIDMVQIKYPQWVEIWYKSIREKIVVQQNYNYRFNVDLNVRTPTSGPAGRVYGSVDLSSTIQVGTGGVSISRPPTIVDTTKIGGQVGGGGVSIRAPGVSLDVGGGNVDLRVSGGGGRSTTSVDIQVGVQQKMFFQTCIHEYETYAVHVTQQQAYFVGLKDIRVWRVDYSIGEDTPQYIETFDDSMLFSGNGSMTLLKDPATNRLYSTAPNQYFETKTLASFSNFQTLQIASQASDWESQLSDGQLSLATYDHLVLLPNTAQQVVTDIVQGKGAGNVLEFTPTGNTEYGVRTQRGIFSVGVGGGTAVYDTASDTYDSPQSYDAGFGLQAVGARTSVVARILLPQTAYGSYELRLWSSGVIVKRQPFTVVPKRWLELEMVYISQVGDGDYQAEVVQTNTNITDPITGNKITEPFDVDLLGVFQNPVRWQVSNDDGVTYKDVAVAMCNPSAFVTCPSPNNKLRVKATALRSGINIQSFILIPWYIGSPLTPRIPIDYISPPGVSEQSDLRDASHNPMFQLWPHFFPQRYSLEQAGQVPLGGSGFHP